MKDGKRKGLEALIQLSAGSLLQSAFGFLVSVVGYQFKFTVSSEENPELKADCC